MGRAMIFTPSATYEISTVMDKPEKMRFPRMIRELRVKAKHRQKDVSDALQLKTSTYANAEVNNHKTMSLRRVHLLSRWYGLDPAATADLAAAWHELPPSAYNLNMEPARAKRREERAKVRDFDRTRVALLELVSLLLAAPDPGALCTCPPIDLFAEGDGDPPCELCNALQCLGLVGFTTIEDTMEKLAELQNQLTG